MTEPLKISVGIDADMYPELYAKLSSLGKGARSEMLRKLASEALSARAWAEVTARSAVPQAQIPAMGVAPRVASALPPGPASVQTVVPAVSQAHEPSSGGQAPIGNPSANEPPAGASVGGEAAHGVADAKPLRAPTARFAAGRMSSSLLRG